MKLDERTMRLIAVGASISANCQPCLEINVTRARESGLDEDEIATAIEVGRMVREGAASKMDKFTAGLSQPVLINAGPSGDGCACEEEKRRIK